MCQGRGGEKAWVGLWWGGVGVLCGWFGGWFKGRKVKMRAIIFSERDGTDQKGKRRGGSEIGGDIR